MSNWLINAKYVEEICGGFVNWEEEFYICPECEEPVYADDWSDDDLSDMLCPICEWGLEDDE